MKRGPTHLRTVGYAAALLQIDPTVIEAGLKAAGVEPALVLNDLPYFASDAMLQTVSPMRQPPATKRTAK